MVKKTVAIFGVIAFLAVTSTAHAGGMTPGTPGPVPKLNGPAVNGVMVVNTHNTGTTVTAAGGATTESKDKLASLWINKGNATAGAIFRLPDAFAVGLGCTLSTTSVSDVTSARFALDPSKIDDNGLVNWMPTDTVNALFTALGISLATAGNPVISTISNAVCTPDPENPSTRDGAPGILSFEVVIQFTK